MKNFSLLLGLSLMLLLVACSKDDNLPQYQSDLSSSSDLTPNSDQAQLRNGATQISGLSRYPLDAETCADLGDAWYVLDLYEGNLVGCLFVTVESYDCLPSGVYLESGTEEFVGAYYDDDGTLIGEGTFSTAYFFSGKFEDCETLAIEVFGRCQHPITPGSGTGVFEGVTGRIDFKDNVETGIFPYRGHLKF